MKHLKIPAFWQAVLVTVMAYLALNNAFPPVTPTTLLVQYMIVVVIGVLLYFSFDDARFAEFNSPILNVLRADGVFYTSLRWFYLLAVPALVGYLVYGVVKPSFEAPVELRQVHPAPPSSLRVFNKKFDLTKLQNPLRTKLLETFKKSPEEGWKAYRSEVKKGRDIFYSNCFFCHGDLLDGEGVYARGFNPSPANFQDVGTIAQLQEAFVFWRITTGGPGLPKEGTPWNSAMPVWHEMLSEDNVWQVITFLYDYVGQVPRIWDKERSRAVTGIKEEILKKRAGMKGKELYTFRCAACHGEEGAGDGPAAKRLYPKPRDFTTGLFKYKTSPGKELPLDEDLFNTIKFGLNGTVMPAWESLMSDEQIKSLIPVLKGFDTFGAWAPADAPDDAFDPDTGKYKGTPISVTKKLELKNQIPYTPESIAQGKLAFHKKDTCSACHGQDGRGNITSGKRLKDDWGNRIWPRDQTEPWTWRVTNVPGNTPEARDATIRNIFTRLSVGIPGTPMPEHTKTVAEKDRWNIANYVYSLRTTRTPLTDKSVVRGTKVTGELPAGVDDKAWQTADATTLKMVPNIIKEDRLFTPLTDAVTVRTLYNDKEIAFLLTIDDRTDSRPGEPVSTAIQDRSLKMHPDAFAIQLPKQKSFSTKGVTVKPLFRHGDAAHPTTIWYWNAGAVKPEAAPRSLLFDGSGPNEKLQSRSEDTSLTATGKWQSGQWKVLMKRPRQGGESGDVNFTEGQFIPISFANWDGSNGEAGSKHTLTSWYWLLLPPQANPGKTWGVPIGIAVLVFLLGLLLVRSQRKRTS